VSVLAAENAAVADVVGAATLVVSEDALSALTARATKVGTRGHETKAVATATTTTEETA
jgi:hypothetical protein